MSARRRTGHAIDDEVDPVDVRHAVLRSLALTAVLALGATAFAPLADPAPASGSLTALEQTVVEQQQLPLISQQQLDELGAQWTTTFLDTADGERLHASILTPVGTDLGEGSDADLPVIAIVSPYLGNEGALDEYGPTDRFVDLFEGPVLPDGTVTGYDGDGSSIFDEGYAVVQVSTRGTGGSSGCLDILGPGEQLDTVTAVEWAAAQPWSNGRVGLYGKSYDGNTGAFAAANQPAGLAAIVAQAIAPDRYRGSYADTTRLAQSLLYPNATYGASAEGEFSTAADPEYNLNGAMRSGDCQALLAEHYLPLEDSAFWRLRDAVDRVAANDSDVPTFVTAGYLDTATNIGAGALQFFENLSGDGHHLWVGWFGHRRGNDPGVGSGPFPDLAMGRAGFLATVLGFYDEHLKGIEDADDEVTVAAQTSTGEWRREDSFPGEDATPFRLDLNSGTYTDEGQGLGSNATDIGAGGLLLLGSPGGDSGVWSITPPLEEDLHVAGFPTVDLTINSHVPGTNIAVNLYDIDPDGQATFLSRGVGNVDAVASLDPTYTETIPMFATDWVLEAGHRLAVFVHDANTESFIHQPTGADVTVLSGVLRMTALPGRGKSLPGSSNNELEAFKQDAPFDASAQVADERNIVTTFDHPHDG